jgi:hypothetical protein
MPLYIASMNLRGKWAPRPENTIVLNVTSAQSKTSKERRDFSPMSEVVGGYKGFHCFENYWQSGKIYEGMSDTDKEKHIQWWQTLTEGKRKYPKAKGMKVLHSNYDDTIRDYITSRKEIYVKEYRDLVKNRESVGKWKQILQEKSVVVYDFDGPRNDEGEPVCLEVTKELLMQKLQDPKHPFGHGYIVAALLANIELEC